MCCEPKLLCEKWAAVQDHFLELQLEVHSTFLWRLATTCGNTMLNESKIILLPHNSQYLLGINHFNHLIIPPQNRII
jgi:hypothetical protein